MFNEEAPTNSVGTGAETSLPPASEPGVTPLTSKRKRAIQKMKKMIQTSTTYTKIFSEAAASSISTYAFRVGLPSLGDLIVYAKSESEVRKVVRKYIKPPYSEHDVAVERLFPAAVVDFYYKKRMKALKNVKDNIIEQFILQDLKEMLPPITYHQQSKIMLKQQNKIKQKEHNKQNKMLKKELH